eukprot:COSAG06_NODE_3458_length_5314_cov_5.266155_3_plen_196_part_00
MAKYQSAILASSLHNWPSLLGYTVAKYGCIYAQLHHRNTQGARRKNRKPLKRTHHPTQHGTSSLEGLLRLPSAKKRPWGAFWGLNTKKGQAFGENNHKSSRSCTPQSLGAAEPNYTNPITHTYNAGQCTQIYLESSNTPTALRRPRHGSGPSTPGPGSAWASPRERPPRSLAPALVPKEHSKCHAKIVTPSYAAA